MRMSRIRVKFLDFAMSKGVLLYFYIKVLRSDSMDSFYSMKHGLLSLSMLRDFSPLQKYFIFELIHGGSKQDTDPFLASQKIVHPNSFKN